MKAAYGLWIGTLAVVWSLVGPSRAGDTAVPRVRVMEENGVSYLVRKGIPEYRIIEGDILVPLQNTAATYDTDLWDGGVVRYEFADNVHVEDQLKMANAMAIMEQVGAVRFDLGKSTFDNGITIESTAPDDCDGCTCANNATVGETYLGHVNICNWDDTHVILHELGHVLNLWHEQSRPDRGTYVRINWDNIPEDKHHNFEVEGDASIYGPYDFESLMHYGQCDFGRTLCPGCPNNASCQDGGRTIVVQPPYDVDWQSRIGNARELSYLDRTTISFLYPRPSWRFVDQRACEFCQSANCVGNSFFCRVAAPSPPVTAVCPACRFADGYAITPVGGTLWIQPGVYSAAGRYSKAMTVQAPLGGVTLGG